jgi:hypothetical protein
MPVSGLFRHLSLALRQTSRLSYRFYPICDVPQAGQTLRVPINGRGTGFCPAGSFFVPVVDGTRLVCA